VGVIGSGWVARNRHIPAYRRHSATEVVAIFDRDEHRGREVARQLGIPTARNDLTALPELDLDVISVCTPPWTHTETVLAALDAGAHVFTEKPMAMNEVDAKMMADTAQRCGQLLCVSHNLLFSRSVEQADRALNKLGAIEYAIGLQLSSPDRRLPVWYRQLPGGLLFDELPHMLYTLQHFLGPLELEGVRGSGATDLIACEIQVRGAEASGHVTSVFTSPISEWHLGLVAQEGVVDLDLFREFAATLPSDRDHTALNILGTSTRAILGHAMGFTKSGIRLTTGRLNWGHDRLIHAFIGAVLGHTPSPIPLDDAVSIVRLTDSILADLGVH
jgi:scyllo-inositol 2-dehydrogenase (NADP+)